MTHYKTLLVCVTWLIMCHDSFWDTPHVCDVTQYMTWLSWRHFSGMWDDTLRDMTHYQTLPVYATWLIRRNEWSWWNFGGLHEIICVWVLWLNRIWDTPRLCIYVWRDYMYVTWLYTCDMTIYMWHDYIYVTWLIMWYSSYMWHASWCDMTRFEPLFTYVSWFAWDHPCMCAMTPFCMWHESFTCVTWLIHMCDMTHS